MFIRRSKTRSPSKPRRSIVRTSSSAGPQSRVNPGLGRTAPIRHCKKDRRTLRMNPTTVCLTISTLRMLSKADALAVLKCRFPAIAVLVNFKHLNSNPRITISTAQRLFWRAICEHLGGESFDGILNQALVHGMPASGPWPRPPTRDLLYSLVFNCHIKNPVWELNDEIVRLELPRAPPPFTNTFHRSRQFVPSPDGFAQIVNESISEAEDFVAQNFANTDLVKYWHGTEGNAMDGIMRSGEIRPTTRDEPHDFASAIYAFKEKPFRAASFGMDRAIISDDTVDNVRENDELKSSIILLLIGIPLTYVTEHEVIVDTLQISIDELDQLKQVVLRVSKKPANNLNELDNWQRFVKYCRVCTKAPQVDCPQPIFSGAMHDVKKTEMTDNCEPPVPDPDGWSQDAIVVKGDAISEIEGAVFIFFELSPAKVSQHPDYKLADYEAALKRMEELQ